MGGRLAKQAPRITLRPRRDSVYKNQGRDETNTKQDRSTTDDATYRKPNKFVVNVPGDRNVRDVLKLRPAKKR